MYSGPCSAPSVVATGQWPKKSHNRMITGIGTPSSQSRSPRPIAASLIAVAVDDHLAIRFPVALLDDRCFAWLAFTLLDHGCSFAISVAVILTYRHPGSNRATP